VAPAPANASAAGITQAIHDLKLSVTAAGRIEALFVKEGDRVRKGDLLLHMDRTLEALEVRRREVMLEDNARLDELRAKELTLAEQVRSARTLLTTGGVSRKQVEDEELTLGAIVAERKSIEFAKRRERVELDLAREAYERRHLRSPIDGMVTRIVSRIGESVAPHEPVMVVVDVRTVRFSGTVPIAEVSRVRAGSSVVLQLGPDAEPLKRLAYVVFVSPVADPASGLVDVIAEFDNGDGSIRPGTAGRILGTSATSALPPAGANRGRR
jgi:RND family efflux transporter MFP subunit